MALLVGWFGLSNMLYAQSVVTTDHVRAELVAHASNDLAAGQPVWLGLAIEHALHWHTYWKNPSDSGLPTTLSWRLPAGVAAGDIQWPTPRQLAGGTAHELWVRRHAAASGARHDSSAIQCSNARCSIACGMVCKEICIPESGDVRVQIRARKPIRTHAALFDAAKAAQPRSDGAQAQARVENNVLAMEVHGLPAGMRGEEVQFFPENAGVVNYAAPLTQRWQGDRLLLRVPLSAQRRESPYAWQAVLTTRSQPAGTQVDVKLVGGWPNAPIGARAAIVPDTDNTHDRAEPISPPKFAANERQNSEHPGRQLPTHGRFR